MDVEIRWTTPHVALVLPQAEGLTMGAKVSEQCERHTKGDGSWWAADGRGIPLCRVCDKCERAKLAKYRPEILEHYTQADVDEPIEPEDY